MTKNNWHFDRDLPAEVDLARLVRAYVDERGRHLKAYPRLELHRHWTVVDTRVLARSKKARHRALADRLAACTDHEPCGLVVCKVCMRLFARGMASRKLAVAERLIARGLKPYAITLVWTSTDVRRAKLPDVSPRALIQRLRMQLRRLGLGRVVLCGALEIDWNEQAEVWEPHIHVVAFLTRREEIEPLREHYQEANDVSRPMQVSRVRDLPRAIVYPLKFRPMLKRRYRRDAKWRSRKIRLDPRRQRQVLAWMAKYKPDDFVFLQGLKRSGSKLVEA